MNTSYQHIIAISDCDQAWKEGNMMKLKNMDVHVKWGGVHMLAGDDYEVEYFEEGVHYVPQGKLFVVVI